MIPLKLTSGEQSLMADLCSLLRGVKYDGAIGKQPDCQTLGERVCDILERYDWCSPQQFDSLYDRFHRSGANS